MQQAKICMISGAFRNDKLVGFLGSHAHIPSVELIAACSMQQHHILEARYTELDTRGEHLQAKPFLFLFSGYMFQMPVAAPC